MSECKAALFGDPVMIFIAFTFLPGLCTDCAALVVSGTAYELDAAVLDEERRFGLSGLAADALLAAPNRPR